MTLVQFSGADLAADVEKMDRSRRPGPKPKRLYARLVRWGDPDRDDLPGPDEPVGCSPSALDVAGRLVGPGDV